VTSGLPALSASVMLAAVEPGFELLRRTLHALLPLDDRAWQEMEPHLRLRSYAADACLLRAGEPSDHVFFVTDGLVREYYTRPDGSERIRGFVRAGRFTAAYADLIAGREAQISIEALAPTTVLALAGRTVGELRARPLWDRLSLRLLEQMYLQKERREFQFLTMTATERYLCLREDVPGIDALVPQYHLASYLGITPVALSRIRGRKRRT
jgi:CRP-like cAMP-binding protein